MINILMKQKRGLNRFSKLPDDGDPWAPNNLLTPEQKKNTSWTPVTPVQKGLPTWEIFSQSIVLICDW